MASAERSVDLIRRRMAEIRSQLHYDMSKVVVEASSATDWRSYVRERPWLFLGGAFALGYILVPRKPGPEAPMPVIPASLLPRENAEGARPSLLWRSLRTVGGLALPVAFRAAQGYALRWIEDFLAEHPPGPGLGSMAPEPASVRVREPRNAERHSFAPRT